MFSIPQSLFKSGLQKAMKATAGKSTLPVLSNILLQYNHVTQRLTIAATNLEFACVVDYPARIEETGAITLPGKRLYDLVAGLPDDVVTVKVDYRTQEATVTCGRFKATVKGIDAEEYPVLPTMPDTPTRTLDGTEFKKGIKAVAPCAYDGIARPTLTGVNIVYGAEQVSMSAADSLRLARYQFTTPASDVTGSVLVPAKMAVDAASIIPDLPVDLVVTERFAMLKCDNVLLALRRIDGDYPNVNQFIEQHAGLPTRAILDAAAITQAVRLGVPFTAGEALPVRLEVTENEGLKVHTRDAEAGDYNATVPVDVVGDSNVHVYVNASFLMAALNAVDAPQLSLTMGKHTQGILLAPVGGNSQFVIMPVTGANLK